MSISCTLWGHIVDNEAFSRARERKRAGRASSIRRLQDIQRRYAEYVCEDCGHPFCFADPIERSA